MISLLGMAEKGSCLNQGNLIQGKAQLAGKNLKNQFGDQKEDSLKSLELCYLLK